MFQVNTLLVKSYFLRKIKVKKKKKCRLLQLLFGALRVKLVIGLSPNLHKYLIGTTGVDDRGLFCRRRAQIIKFSKTESCLHDTSLISRSIDFHQIYYYFTGIIKI